MHAPVDGQLSSKAGERGSARWESASGAPRGMLRLYILQKVSKAPTHGYEIMSEIDEKTGGGWRPSPGSVYLVLKELLSQKLIAESKPRTEKRGGAEQRAYTITSEGLRRLNAAKKLLLRMGERWSSLRGLFLEMIDAEDAGRFLIQGTMRHTEMAHELFQKCEGLDTAEKLYMLREYQLMLDKEAGWVRGALRKFEGNAMETQRPSARARGR